MTIPLCPLYIACLYGNNENEFVYRCLERDRMEEEELIDQEKYFWEEYVEKKIEPPYSGKPDLILASIRKYSGYADKSIPEISMFAKCCFRFRPCKEIVIF